MRLRPPAHRVSPRAIALWELEYLIAGLLLAGVAWGAAAWIEASQWPALPETGVDNIWWLPRLALSVAVFGVAAAPLWRYRVHRWEVSSDVVYTRTGWFHRHWLLVPVSRIQTVDAEQGWFERLLGLATLKVTTASHEGSSKVSGLRVEQAAGLAAELARRAHDLRDDAT